MGFAQCLALIFMLLSNDMTIKKLVKRVRPYDINTMIDTIVPKQSSFSFPSGHACAAFACATAIFCFNKRLGIAAYIMSLFISFSQRLS